MPKERDMVCPTTGKTQYPSELAAEKGLKRFRERNPDYDGGAYLCLYCREYHFGSRKPLVRKRRKRT